MKEIKVLRRLRDSLTILLTVALGYLCTVLILFIKPVYKVGMADLKFISIIILLLISIRILCNLGIEILKVKNIKPKKVIVKQHHNVQPLYRESKGA